MKALSMILVATLTLSACASRPSVWRPATLHLEAGMNENQAIAAIGSAPDNAEVVTCGVNRGASWECRRLSFTASGTQPPHTLIVYEANYGGVWRVDSWNAL